VARHRVLEDVEELLRGEALDELTRLGGREFKRVRITETVLIKLALLGQIHCDWDWNLEEIEDGV